MNIISAFHDKRFFASLFKDIETWRAWETYLKVLFGLPLDIEKEGNLFKECTGLDVQPKGPSRETYVICGRRSGKSFISAIIAVYLAGFRNWREVLGPGERGFVFVVAVDRQQAKVIKGYVSGILRSTAHFKKMVQKDLTWEVELKNQTTISVKTSDFRTIRGFTLLAAICEEMAFWRSEHSANPDREILTALKPALSTIEDSLLIAISTPYARRGVLFEQFDRYYGKSGGPLIWKAPTALMNPTIDKGKIQKAFEDDPAAAQAEWGAQFRRDTEAFISEELVEAAIVPKRMELPRVDGFSYRGFCDPSGGRQDSFTLAVAHAENKRIVLDLVREVRSPFKPAEVVEQYAQLLRIYGLSEVGGDRYSGAWVQDAFRGKGIVYKSSKLSKSEIYLDFLPLVSNGAVELLDNKGLKVQLASLERRTRSGGKDIVDNFLGHDDVANSAAGACVLAAKESTIQYSTVSWSGNIDEGEEEENLYDELTAEVFTSSSNFEERKMQEKSMFSDQKNLTTGEQIAEQVHNCRIIKNGKIFVRFSTVLLGVSAVGPGGLRKGLEELGFRPLMLAAEAGDWVWQPHKDRKPEEEEQDPEIFSI